MGRPIVVVGGGVGGLATAIGLRRRGIDVDVLERRRGLDRLEIGGGMLLWPNAMAALDRLGIGAPVAAAGSRIERFDIRTPAGSLLASPPLAPAERAHGAPAIALTRRALLGVLASALPPERLHFGAEVTGLRESGAGVTVELGSGGTRDAEAIIGADGKDSAVRNLHGLAGPGYPSYAGYVLWRGIAATAAVPPRVFTILLGCGIEAYFFGLDEGRAYWAVARFGPALGAALASGEALRNEVLGLVGDWSQLPDLVRQTAGGDMTRSDILGGQPLAEWGRGRVTLLGDAAHPMTTTLGQGACQAIEDAVVLADAVATAEDVVAGLRGYERRRMARTARVMSVARRFEQPSRSGRTLACRLRDTGIGRFLRSPSRIDPTGYWRVTTEVP